jgi:membrane dipeptidase
MEPSVPSDDRESSQPPILWEQHCCLPLSTTANVSELARYHRPGGSYVSVNAGYAPHSRADVVGLVEAWKQQITTDAQLLLQT